MVSVPSSTHRDHEESKFKFASEAFSSILRTTYYDWRPSVAPPANPQTRNNAVHMTTFDGCKLSLFDDCSKCKRVKDNHRRVSMYSLGGYATAAAKEN